LKALIKRWVEGTPLEGIAHAAYRAVTGKPPLGPAPDPNDRNTQYDVQTAAVLARVLARDSNCLDVGCHVGAIMDEMLRRAPRGRHVGFEPLPHLYSALLKKYAATPNVELHELALSEAPGEATFQHVVTNPGYSGLLKRRYDRPHEDVVEIRVKVARLDDIVGGERPVRLVKIDVEGAELQVMKGAIATLTRWKPFIVFEHGLGAADIYGTRPEMVFDLLAECGLSVSLMGDWLSSQRKRALSREAFADEFDAARNHYFLAHP
jgi:FkbM family methyltransferase